MLIKKELETIPLLLPPELMPEATGIKDYLTAVDLVDLPRSGPVLVADLYRGRDKSFGCRFVSDGKSYLTTLKWPAESWGKFNPTVHYWYSCSSTNYPGDTKLAERFLGKKENESWRSTGALAVIDAFITDIQTEKRYRAEDRKEVLRKKHFAMYPPLPTDLKEFCENIVFDYGYIFFDKLTKTGRRYGRCCNCGKKFRVAKDVKQNQETVCPHCGRQSLYKASWRSKAMEDREKICITAKVEGQLLIRWVSATRIVTCDGRRSYHFFDYAYNLYIQNKNKSTIYTYEFRTIPYTDGNREWTRWPNDTQNFSEAYIYTGNLDEVFGTNYYNVDMKAGLHGKRVKICFTDLLNSLKNTPEAEYLFKLNMPVLASKAKYLVDGKKRKPGFTEVLGVSKQLLPMYSSMGVTYQEHLVIKNWGAWVSPDDLKLYRKLKIDHDIDLVENMLKMMSFGKFTRYFVKQREATRKSTHSLMIQYRDYISMAKKLKIDLSRKSLRFPANICTAHDDVLQEFNRLKFEKEKRRLYKSCKVSL